AFDLACVDRVTPRVPADVEPAAVAGDPFRGRVVRRVTRAGREVQEEPPVGVDRAQVAEILDGAVGDGGAEGVSVLERRRRNAPGGTSEWLSWYKLGLN